MKVSVLMGSDNDWKVVKNTCQTLKNFGVSFEVHVLSAHRSLPDLLEHLKYAEEKNCKVFVCAAGMAAHLGGVVAANTVRPVIGLPLSGGVAMDSLLSNAQMPPGIPIATVAVDGGMNAALLAVEMLALSDKDLLQKLKDYREGLRRSVREKDKNIQYLLDDLSGPN